MKPRIEVVRAYADKPDTLALAVVLAAVLAAAGVLGWGAALTMGWVK